MLPLRKSLLKRMRCGYRCIHFGVTGLVFIVLRVVPGDPVAVLLNEHVSAEAISRMKQSVSSLIITAFPYTLKLTVLSAAFAWIFGIAAGIVCAMYQDKVPDHLFCGVSLFGISVPVFVIALILQYVLHAQDLSGRGMRGILIPQEPKDLQQKPRFSNTDSKTQCCL